MLQYVSVGVLLTRIEQLVNFVMLYGQMSLLCLFFSRGLVLVCGVRQKKSGILSVCPAQLSILQAECSRVVFLGTVLAILYLFKALLQQLYMLTPSVSTLFQQLKDFQK